MFLFYFSFQFDFVLNLDFFQLTDRIVVRGLIFTVDRLSESSFYLCNEMVEIVLVFRKLDGHIKLDRMDQDGAEGNVVIWLKNNAIANAVTGLSQEDEHLEHATDFFTVDEIRQTILDLFQREKILNELANRRKVFFAQVFVCKYAILFIS